jgi:hypothetical protein
MVEQFRLTSGGSGRNTGEPCGCAGILVGFAKCQKRMLSIRYFLLSTCEFNLFTGTGYFFFFGVTNFGDWAVVISGLHLHWLWRMLLAGGGTGAYYVAVRVVGIGLVTWEFRETSSAAYES